MDTLKVKDFKKTVIHELSHSLDNLREFRPYETTMTKKSLTSMNWASSERVNYDQSSAIFNAKFMAL